MWCLSWTLLTLGVNGVGEMANTLPITKTVTTVASPRAAILILRVVVRRWCDPDQLNASTVKRKGNHTSERF